MNPTGGEPVNPGATAPISTVGESPIGAAPGVSSPDISRVENLVAAAAQEAQAAQTGTAPTTLGQEAPLTGREKAFKDEFSLDSPTSTVTEQPAAPAGLPDLMDKALQGLGSEAPTSTSTPDISAVTPTLDAQPASGLDAAVTTSQPEQTPVDPKEKFKYDVVKAAEELIASLEAKPEEKVAA